MSLILFIFLLGLVVGSFLNVVILRLDENFTYKTLLGRSYCPICKKTLGWYELVPVFSFALQKGRCTECETKISLQYPIVELLTGIMFVFVALSQGVMNYNIFNFGIFEFFNLVYLFAIFSLLIVMTVYDIYHKLIPDSMSFLFAGLSLVYLVLVGWGDLTWVSLLAGPILAFPFAFLWLVSRGRWIGFGDAKLALGIGWFLGLVDGISAIVLAFWIGSIFGILLIGLSKLQSLSFFKNNFTIKSEIPFAPFLILGTILIFFFGWDILGLKIFFI